MGGGGNERTPLSRDTALVFWTGSHVYAMHPSRNVDNWRRFHYRGRGGVIVKGFIMLLAEADGGGRYDGGGGVLRLAAKAFGGGATTLVAVASRDTRPFPVSLRLCCWRCGPAESSCTTVPGMCSARSRSHWFPRPSSSYHRPPANSSSVSSFFYYVVFALCFFFTSTWRWVGVRIFRCKWKKKKKRAGHCKTHWKTYTTDNLLNQLYANTVDNTSVGRQLRFRGGWNQIRLVIKITDVKRRWRRKEISTLN